MAPPLIYRTFRHLPEYLRADDVLVINDTRVLPTRLQARKDTGGAMEVLLVRPRDAHTWEAMTRPARRVRPGTILIRMLGVKGQRNLHQPSRPLVFRIRSLSGRGIPTRPPHYRDAHP